MNLKNSNPPPLTASRLENLQIPRFGMEAKALLSESCTFLVYNYGSLLVC